MLEELERKVGTSYKYKDVFSTVGRLTQSLSHSLLDSINSRVSEGDHVIHVFRDLAESSGIEIDTEYDSALNSLLESGNLENTSFIFYGDHSRFLEPFLFTISLPDLVRERIIREDSALEESVLSVLGTDMILISLPSIARHITPVIVRDSYLQKITCRRNFIEKRRSQRGDVNIEAIRKLAEFISVPGRNSLIYPQGAGRSWKTGIIRVLAGAINNTSEKDAQIYLVPVSCVNLKRRKIVRMFINSKLRKLGIHTKTTFRTVYGKPMQVSDFLSDLPKGEIDIDDSKKYMTGKINLLQKTYEDWVKTL